MILKSNITQFLKRFCSIFCSKNDKDTWKEMRQRTAEEMVYIGKIINKKDLYNLEFTKGEIVKLIVHRQFNWMSPGAYVVRLQASAENFEKLVHDGVLSFEQATLEEKESWYKLTNQLDNTEIFEL